MNSLQFIEITKQELEAVRLRDIKHLPYSDCAKKLLVSKKEFKRILKSARKKCASSLVENKSIVIEKEKEKVILPTTLCTFRCATCGKIYSINYFERDPIICPNCEGEKVMTSEEAGFNSNYYIDYKEYEV